MREIQIGDEEDLFELEGGQALGQAVWRSCAVSTAGNVQEQVGWTLSWDG